MGLFDRISRVVRSNLNSLVSAAEDPEKILEQTITDMQEDLIQLRQAVAQAIASQKRLERQQNQAQVSAEEWQRRAQLALTKGDENLAREALSRRKPYVETASSLKVQLDSQSQMVAKLKQNMQALESKLSEAKSKKDMYIARARSAQASQQINEILGRVNTSNSLTAFERMEEKVLQMEAQSDAVAEISGDSLDKQFAALEAGGDVDLELAAMKAQLAGSNANPGALPEARAAEPRVSGGVDAELEQLRAQLDKS
ncbi:PspA/IM30 family protein [Leptolyngbya sp. FACHB-261]|uniref:PspA/IM30 family protein n=1 Tax=Leptolyngbya sp. FACHB-261 TaxID=2692806 RepID=UPI0016894E9E|nr:PspA/IM30 family protein [Leptolyngbya sp. FACHB-261]MBD2099516.1 PspA/IM30 family protein [Leptolyngbya sp. FACHB-261]